MPWALVVELLDMACQIRLVLLALWACTSLALGRVLRVLEDIRVQPAPHLLALVAHGCECCLSRGLLPT